MTSALFISDLITSSFITIPKYFGPSLRNLTLPRRCHRSTEEHCQWFRDDIKHFKVATESVPSSLLSTITMGRLHGDSDRLSVPDSNISLTFSSISVLLWIGVLYGFNLIGASFTMWLFSNSYSEIVSQQSPYSNLKFPRSYYFFFLYFYSTLLLTFSARHISLS